MCLPTYYVSHLSLITLSFTAHHLHGSIPVTVSPNTCSFGDHAIVWCEFWGFLAIGLKLLEHDGFNSYHSFMCENLNEMYIGGSFVSLLIP